MGLRLTSEVSGLRACLDSQEGFSVIENYLSCTGGQRLRLALHKKTSNLNIWLEMKIDDVSTK